MAFLALCKKKKDSVVSIKCVLLAEISYCYIGMFVEANAPWIILIILIIKIMSLDFFVTKRKHSDFIIYASKIL